MTTGDHPRTGHGAFPGVAQRDKVNLDIFWLKDDSIEDSANLPAPAVIAKDIADNLAAALEQFEEIYKELEKE
jgi:type I restriction enzyme M protein